MTYYDPYRDYIDYAYFGATGGNGIGRYFND